ncbi:hypothetical protein FRUB_01198 [Fimbriiglobus ruber]|uniref:Uncharacterized protein n=1 Tax=Fimbriiglobus ruber TaxID=1908690 RepID=A0A225EDX8_9BACT|nr:hypothetical protein FRUB_01198 [Fimbriiglobus ruber]
MAGLAAGLLVGGVGCVSCNNKGFSESLHPTATCEYPPYVRQKVYLFMMNGLDVLEFAGMLDLRDKLSKTGYPKVYYAQREDKEWYYRELRRVVRDDPSARVLLLGYGACTDRVLALARDSIRDQLPLDGVIFIDPVGVDCDLQTTLPTHTMIIRSPLWVGGTGLSGTENITVSHTHHYSVPNHPSTVEFIHRLMSESASRVRIESTDNIPRLPLYDKPLPTPRPIDPATLLPPPPEWTFLKPPCRYPSMVIEPIVIPIATPQ